MPNNFYTFTWNWWKLIWWASILHFYTFTRNKWKLIWRAPTLHFYTFTRSQWKIIWHASIIHFYTFTRNWWKLFCRALFNIALLHDTDGTYFTSFNITFLHETNGNLLGVLLQIFTFTFHFYTKLMKTYLAGPDIAFLHFYTKPMEYNLSGLPSKSNTAKSSRRCRLCGHTSRKWLFRENMFENY